MRARSDSPKVWTDAELALLTDLIDQGVNRRDIADRLNRTMDGVSAKARRLELVRRRPRLQLESGAGSENPVDQVDG
jgi:hypothetical protein